mgnify:CR=1 FL=1
MPDDVADQLRDWSKSLARTVDPTSIERVKSPTTVGNASSAGNRRWLAVAASIVLAADRSGRPAVGVRLVLAARAVGAIPFVRVKIMRLRRGHGPVWHSDVAQATSVAVAAIAVVADRRLLAGLVGVVVLAVMQSVWVRRAPVPAKQVGLRQMAMGLALVAVTTAGVLW